MDDINTITARQHTLASPIHFSGVALHSGDMVEVTIRPAAVDTGIRFIRTDVGAERGTVSACYASVCETTLGTTLRNAHGTTVATVEHLMAALSGMDIDNAEITLDGPEVPIMDGSSEPFVFLLECAGLAQQEAPRRMIEVLRRIEVSEGGSTAVLEPHEDGFALDITIDFPHDSVGRQQALYDFSVTSFKRALCRARTFGFAREVEKMHSMGLALGGSLKNAVVIGDEGVLNEEGLRYPDEFVRHKALDVIGDYALAGAPIRGKATTVRPGHGINNKLMRALFADPANYRILGEEGAGLDMLPCLSGQHSDIRPAA